MKFARHGIFFYLAALALAGAFFLAAVLAGHAIVVSRHIFYNDILFGNDTQRYLAILTEPGLRNRADLERSNVHPFFSPLVKPWAQFVQQAGITKAVSGVIVNAGAGAGALLLAAWYFGRRGLAPSDALLLMLLTGASASWVCMSAIPGAFIFSLNIIIFSFILADWTLKRPDPELTATARCCREALWLATGLINYGITVTNGMFSFLAYGFSRRHLKGWVRAALYGTLVLGVGLLLTWLIGSALNIVAEKQWAVNEELRGGTPPWISVIVTVTPLLWSFVVPWPTFHAYKATLPDGHLLTENIAGILQWKFTAVDWVLLACWAVMLLAALRAAVVDRDPVGRRLSGGLAACLAFHIVMHRFYYIAFEGVFFFTPHSLFLVTGLCAPLMANVSSWPARAKWGFRALLLILALALLTRNYHYFYALRALIPLPVEQ